VLTRLPPSLAQHTRAETHGCALELASSAHATVGAATAELARLRAALAEVVRRLGLDVAVAATHPLAKPEETQVSPGARYQHLHSSLQELARRTPTFGLHVHVAVPSPALAVQSLNRMRAHLPLLLALSGNSPFHGGRDSGLASARTPLFQAFPRTGLPREFEDYAEYVEAIDVLVRSEAIPEPTFIWWDARLQPSFGTLEVRIMDAQTRVADTAALAALVQCLVRVEALDGFAEPGPPEVLAENRFIATRDGGDAALIDAPSSELVPIREQLPALLAACRPHAEALGCAGELDGVEPLARATGAARQRAVVEREGELEALVPALVREFAPRPAATVPLL
jgi:carboxylate-amine ligase